MAPAAEIERASVAADGAEESGKFDHSVSPKAPLLRVPPFPGCRSRTLALPARSDRSAAATEAAELLEAVRQQRVGGTYWGAQPQLPSRPYALIKTDDRAALSELLGGRAPERVVWWASEGSGPFPLDRHDSITVSGDCDPWHLMSGASEVIVDQDDELALLAAIASLPLKAIEGGNSTRRELRRIATNAILAFDYLSPFTGESIGTAEAIRLCGFWRTLIDSNRSLTAAVGFAFWKRPSVTPLLWAGSGKVPFISASPPRRKDNCVALWRSRTPQPLLAELARNDTPLVEVEDGFIRSSGLGADCVPPLSIVVDGLGIHFDPTRPSKLEEILETGEFGPGVIDRARQLREAIVGAGLSKYGSGRVLPSVRRSGQRIILVPGQVEDDRAVLDGGGPTSNAELLRRVRNAAPDARILYKPHPDVEAGHRRGAIPDEICRGLADEIMRGQSISSLLDAVDEVHVNTSLAGFESLLREKPVTTYGVPFYAGWGLTKDLGPVPERRTATRSLDELVAAALLIYPRYLDPLTGLPCPPEVLIKRLSGGLQSRQGPIVGLRRLQGRCRRGLMALRRLVAVR